MIWEVVRLFFVKVCVGLVGILLMFDRSEVIWLWRILYGKVLNYEFHFFNTYRDIQIFYFLCVLSLVIQRIGPFNLSSCNYWHKVVYNNSIIFSVSLGCEVIPHVSFLISVILSFLSLLINPVRHLSILLIF